MDYEKQEKVRAEHRARNAYLYVRQSTMRQVLENGESTKRQYGCGSERRRWDGTRSKSW